MKKIIIILIILFVGIGGYYLGVKSVKVNKNNSVSQSNIKSFDECVTAGFPVLESYPRQCKTSDKTFFEDIGNILNKANLITLDYPKPNQTVVSPLKISGKAKGSWFFEAQFPVSLYAIDSNNPGQKSLLVKGIAKAEGNWMTEEFVPFSLTLNFTKGNFKKGELVLTKDNPSGLPENDDELRIPVKF